MVELIENNLHSLVEELERWRALIGNHYIEYLVDKQGEELVKSRRRNKIV